LDSSVITCSTVVSQKSNTFEISSFFSKSIVQLSAHRSTIAFSSSSSYFTIQCFHQNILINCSKIRVNGKNKKYINIIGFATNEENQLLYFCARDFGNISQNIKTIKVKTQVTTHKLLLQKVFVAQMAVIIEAAIFARLFQIKIVINNLFGSDFNFSIVFDAYSFFLTNDLT